jgi:hypothetical protein
MPLALAAVAVALVLVTLGGSAAADPLAPGRPDLTFAGDGRLRASFGADEIGAAQVVPLPTGRLLVLTTSASIVRLTPAGRLDGRFGRRGVARAGVGGDGNSYVAAMALDGDGSLVVAGRQRSDAVAVRRLRPDGRADRAFGSGGLVVWGTDQRVGGVDVVVRDDGTALVAALVIEGAWYSPEVSVRLLILALDRFGRLVPAFGEGGVATVPLSVRPGYVASGRLLFELPDGNLRYVLGRDRGPLGLLALTAAGAPDAAFGPGGQRRVRVRFPTWIEGAAVDASGRLVLAGSAARGTLVAAAVTPAGELDRTFSGDGVARLRLGGAFNAAGIAVREDGGLAVGLTRYGRRGRGRMGAAVLRRDGRLLRRFGRRGVATVGSFRRRRGTAAGDVAVDRLGRLVIGGLTGDGLSSIRDDFGRDYVALARLRLRRAPLHIPARLATRRGAVLVPVRCRAAVECRGELRVSRAGRRGDAAFRLAAGRRRTLRVPLRGAGELAARRLTVRVAATVTTGTRTEPLAVRARL